MTDETPTDTNDEEEQNRELIAWLKTTLVALVARVRSAVAQSVEEIEPQLRGTLERLHIPAGAVKPLALAAVLVVAAVAMPAAPFAGDATNNSTEEAVSGTTYDPVDGNDLRDVVSNSLGAATSSAPPAPSDVRTSAGSQTMSVQTDVVDGDPAIVLEDDRTHDGRWVAIETAWFQEHVGEVPQVARVKHESNGTYSTPIEARGEQAAFYVEEFSTNTVTFDGVLSVSGGPAVDGDTISYEAPNGGSDLSIDLTGVENTAPDSASMSASGSGTLPISVDGNTAPRNESVTITGVRETTAKSTSDTFTSSGTLAVDTGNVPADNIQLSVAGGANTASKSVGEWIYDNEYSESERTSETTVSTDSIDTIEQVYINTYVNLAGLDDSNMEVYIDGEKQGSYTVIDGEKESITIDIGSVPVDNDVTVKFYNPDYGTIKIQSYELRGMSPGTVTASTDTGDSESLSMGESTSIPLKSNTNGVTIDGISGGTVDASLSYDKVIQTQNPSVSVGGSTVSESGVMSPGDTKTGQVDLSTGAQSADVSASGPVDVSASWTEVSETRDPVVEYNGQTASYSGTLSDGETTSLPVNDSWINEGTNDLSVSLPSVSSGPVPQVGVDVTHDVSESRTIDYSAEAFSERYTTSKTWSENTSNATLSVPWASSSVVSVRDISVTYEDSTGATPSPRPNPTHRLENGSVVVELGDVKAGWTTEISAAGSKVQVDGADLEVINATAAGEDLDSRIRLNSPSDDVYLRVGETEQGQQLHYLANASWSNEEASQISADGTNEIRIPNAPDNGEAQLRTLPLAFDVETGAIDVDIPDGRLNEGEPVYRVSSAGSTGDSYHVTFTEAKDGQPYVLWSETREIVLDEGMASSPLTLSAEDSEETQVIQFREDDGTVTSSDGGVGGAIAGAAPMVTTSSPFSGLGGFLPGPSVFIIGLAGLVGLTFVARRTQLFDEGTASDAVADSAASVGERAGGLLGRALSNELVLAGLTLAGGVWLLTSGAFTETERLIISLGSVPVAMFLVLQQFDQFDLRVWAGSTAVVAVLGIQALAPEVFTTIAEEAGIVIVAGALILGWRALSAWRAEASTPETVNRLRISTEDDDDT